jgi:hypothetical protein
MVSLASAVITSLVKPLGFLCFDTFLPFNRSSPNPPPVLLLSRSLPQH